MSKWLKRIAVVIGAAVFVLIIVVAVNTVRYVPKEVSVVEAPELEVDVVTASSLLSRAVQFRTISTDTSHPDFGRFLSFLKDSFPRVHTTMQLTVLEGKTPLFKWPGSDETRPPVLFAAHYDVVPALADALDRWEHPPFRAT